jgi:hypothetical protein
MSSPHYHLRRYYDKLRRGYLFLTGKSKSVMAEWLVRITQPKEAEVSLSIKIYLAQHNFVENTL